MREGRRDKGHEAGRQASPAVRKKTSRINMCKQNMKYLEKFMRKPKTNFNFHK